MSAEDQATQIVLATMSRPWWPGQPADFHDQEAARIAAKLTAAGLLVADRPPGGERSGREIIGAMRHLADLREHYGPDDRIDSEVGALRTAADIFDGTNDGASYIPTWLWDRWADYWEGASAENNTHGGD